LTLALALVAIWVCEAKTNAWAIRWKIFLKMAIPHFNASIVQVPPKLLTCPRVKILLEYCRPLNYLKRSIFKGLTTIINHLFYACAVLMTEHF
jgi:hypothetical protein